MTLRRNTSSQFAIGAQVLIDGTGRPAVENPVITIANGRIQSIASRTTSQKASNGVRLIEYAQCTVLPGLVDTHLHLASVANTSREPLPPGDADLSEYLAGVGRAQSALAAGVTTVRDCGGPGLYNIRLRDTEAARLWRGPRILACGYPLTTTAGHCHWWGGRADDAQDLRRRVRWLFEHRVDFIKVMATGGVLTPGSNPYRAQYTVEELSPAVEDAHRLGLRVAAHCLSTEGVLVAVQSGVDTIEHGWTVTTAPENTDSSVTDAMLRSDTTASVTASQWFRALLPGKPTEDLAELRRRLQFHRALYEAGVPMVVHSDAVGETATRFSDFAESVQVFAFGMDTSPERAIAAATGHAARAIGRDRDLGTVEVGKIADLTVVRGDVRRSLEALRRVRSVFRDGVELVHNGRLVAGGNAVLNVALGS